MKKCSFFLLLISFASLVVSINYESSRLLYQNSNRPSSYPLNKIISSPNSKNGSEIIHEWKDLEYKFPTHQDKEYALRKGLYEPGNGVLIDVAVHYNKVNNDRRIFVTIPRFVKGIPMTLATVTNIASNKGPKLEAYPTYEVQSSHGFDCDGITSVFRVAIDPCNRMWVVDTGRINEVQHCAPQLLIFDLTTDLLVHRYRFPQSQFKTGVSLFVTPILDVHDPPPRGYCRNTKVYIADVTGFGIIVYDSLNNTSWRIQNKLLYSYPDYGTIKLAGENFDLMDGVIGMDISPKHYQGERHLYFHSLASGVESAVPLSILNNYTIWKESSESHPRAFKTIGIRGTQSVAEAMDSKGNLFFGLMDPIAIAFWNINTPYTKDSIKILAKNDETLQFASGVKVVKNKKGEEELWVSTNRFQKVAADTKNSNEINFRIHKFDLNAFFKK